MSKLLSLPKEKVEVKAEAKTETKTEVEAKEPANKTILALGLDPLLRDKVFQKPDINLTDDLNSCYFSGPDAIYKGSADFDHTFSQDQKSGYQTQLGAWLARVKALSTEIQFDEFAGIETLINKINNPKEFYNFATDAIRDKTIASVKQSLEFILLRLLQKFQLAKDGSRTTKDEMIAILSQIVAAGEGCSSQLKNIKTTVDLLALDPGVIGRIHAYLLEVILPNFYQRCIEEENLDPGYHVHVEENTRMWLSQQIADLHWLNPPAEDDFAQVPRTKENISKIRDFIATNLIDTLREELTFEAICLREVLYRLPQALVILKKYQGEDLNRVASSIEEEPVAEVDELDREVKRPSGKEVKGEQGREVKRHPGKEIKSDRDREVKRPPRQETESEPDAKKEMTYVSNLLLSEFNELIHFGACGKGDLIVTDDEEDDVIKEVKLILNPEFEVNLFFYYMDYVAKIMFQLGITGEFSSYAATETSIPHTTDGLIEAFENGRLYTAKMLVDAGVDFTQESKEVAYAGEGRCALSVVLFNCNFNSGQRKIIYADAHSQIAALNLLLTAKKSIDINKFSDELLPLFVSSGCHPGAFSRFTDWILNQKSGVSIFQRLIFNEQNSIGCSTVEIALQQAWFPFVNKPEIFLILLKKIKIDYLKNIVDKVSDELIIPHDNLVLNIVDLILDINSEKPVLFDKPEIIRDSANFKRFDQFESLLKILRQQCVLAPEFYLFLADKVVDTLEKLMFILELRPDLAEKFDCNRPLYFYGLFKRSYPIAIKGEKNAKRQQELVNLFLKNKKWGIQNDAELMNCAVGEGCCLDTFKIFLNHWISAPDQKNDAIKRSVLKKVLEHDNLGKLKVLLQNVNIMDNITLIEDITKICGGIIRFLFDIKYNTGLERIIFSYVGYCSLQSSSENIDFTLTLPIFSPELRMILDKQLGVERRKILAETISVFNTTNKIRSVLTMVVPDKESQMPSAAEFKSAVQAFLDEAIGKLGIDERPLYNYLNTFFYLYSHKKRISDESNNPIQFYQFISILFNLVPREHKIPIIGHFLFALKNFVNLNVVADIFCNELIAEFTINEDQEFLFSILKFLEETLEYNSKDYDQFLKPIFEKLQQYSSFYKCADIILLGGSHGIRHDYIKAPNTSHRLYNSVRNIVLAIGDCKNLDEIKKLLTEFDSAAKGSKFSRIDLVKIIRTQFVNKPKLYEPFFTYLFDQTIQSSQLDQKAVPGKGIEKILVQALEKKPLNFLCYALIQGETGRVIHALNHGADLGVVDRTKNFTPLKLVLWNNAASAPALFSAEDQLLIVNAMLSRADVDHIDSQAWDVLYQSKHGSFALCIRFSQLSSLQPAFPNDNLIAYLISQMGELWKSCSIIKQPDQYKVAAAILCNCFKIVHKIADTEIMGTILTDDEMRRHILAELKKQLSQSQKEYHEVLAECYKLLDLDKPYPELCQHALQSRNVELLSQLLAVCDNPAAAIDDFKSYPVQLALCQHPEWLEVKESKQTLLSFTSAQPNCARIIAYLKEILPKAPNLSVPELTSLHTTLLATHKITLEEIKSVELYRAIFDAVLQPRIKLSDPVHMLAPPSVS